MEINKFPVINMSEFIKIHKVQQFQADSYGNFSHLLTPAGLGYIYVISNANEILQLKADDLMYITKYSMKNKCNEQVCETTKIALINYEDGFLKFCYTHQSIHNTKSSSLPTCRIIQLDGISQSDMGIWPAQAYISSDFHHQSVQSVIGGYSYNGVYSMDEQLNIYRNTLALGINEIDKISLPRYFLKSPGDFITSFTFNKSIYFLYLETDFTCGFKEDQLVTRLIELCVNDRGNDNKMFSLLGKVDVECKSSNNNKNIPAYTYRIASKAIWLRHSKQLVVTFVNQNEVVDSSAICVYSIDKIAETFNSKLKMPLKKSASITNPIKNICSNVTGDWKIDMFNHYHTLFINFPLREKILMNETVYAKQQIQFLELAADERNLAGSSWTVLFMSTMAFGRTSIMQILLQPSICVLRKFLLKENVTTLAIVKEFQTSVLYIGTSKRLLKISMDTCNEYYTERSCLISNIPYCYWNFRTGKCSNLSTYRDSAAISTLLSCSRISTILQPLTTKLRTQCKLMSVYDEYKTIGSCNCEHDTNSSWKSKKISVSNDCKVDGNWTAFSPWSDCSVTCGMGNQVRIRRCENPRPQRGGNHCQGDETEIRTCNTEIKCEDRSIKIATDWSEWSKCSRTCGLSYRVRNRQCVKERCALHLQEKKLCVLKHCEFVINSQWSQWSKFDALSKQKKRFRFRCIRKYRSIDRKLSFNFITKLHYFPNCSSEDCITKTKQTVLNKMNYWSAWSDCGDNCNSVEWTRRSRSCPGSSCMGSLFDYQPCSTTPCQSTWSCWSQWKGCPKTCESKGIQIKRRQCIYDKNKSFCPGKDKETLDCEMIPCNDNYSQWSDWSFCKPGGVITRSRKCLSNIPCLFPLLQSKPCYYPLLQKTEEYSFVYMIVSGLVGLVVGLLLAGVICYIWWRCTMNVITSTYSESMKLNKTGIPINEQSIYDSQSLHIGPDIYGSLRQRSTSTGDNYFTNPSPNRFPEPTSFTFMPTYYMKHPPLAEEQMDTHI